MLVTQLGLGIYILHSFMALQLVFATCDDLIRNLHEVNEQQQTMHFLSFHYLIILFFFVVVGLPQRGLHRVARVVVLDLVALLEHLLACTLLRRRLTARERFVLTQCEHRGVLADDLH